MIRKICSSDSTVDCDGQWESLLLGIEVFVTKCHDLSTSTVHLRQLWAETGLSLFWQTSRFMMLCLMAMGCQKGNPAFLMKRVNEPGSLTDGEGRELGSYRVRFRHFPSWRQMGLDCIGQVKIWEYEIRVQRRKSWWQLIENGYTSFYTGVIMFRFAD